MRTGVLALLFVALTACSTYRDQLARGERAFEQNDPNKALAILRDLEPSFQRLSPQEQASYAYLRGMTDYSVGYKLDARHWLSLANAYEQQTPGVLAGDRKAKTADALRELNDIVYMKGEGELVNAPPADSAAPAASASPSSKPSKKKKKETPATTPPVDDAGATSAPAAQD
jgi:hypothetical protein